MSVYEQCAKEVIVSSFRLDIGNLGFSNLDPLLFILPEFLCGFTWFSSVSAGNDCDANKYVMTWYSNIPVLRLGVNIVLCCFA